MCGRFALRLDRNAIHNELDVDVWHDEDAFYPRYNIAPRTNAPVLRRAASSNNVVLHTMKWGLVPHWSTVEDKSLSTTNARADNLVDGAGMWGALRSTKRCVVPCQGYYEWLNRGKQKLPHFTKRKDGALLLLAGLYDSAVIEGQTLWTFTIVTTDANKDFSWLHDRQPVILSSEQAVVQWLDTSSKSWSKQLTALLQPYHDQNVPLDCYQVPQEVGKVGTESPSFIEPVATRKDGIQAMFQKQRQSQSKNKRSQSTSPVPLSKNKRARTPSPVPSSSQSKKQTRTPSPSPRKKKKTIKATDSKPITAFFAKK